MSTLKLKEEPKAADGRVIHVTVFADGQIAVIHKWPGAPYHEGTIVQRYGNDLVSLGKPEGKSWRDRCTNNHPGLVRVLPTGTELQVTDDGFKVVSEPPVGVHIDEMKNGDIAVLLESSGGYGNGSIIQRRVDGLVVLGGTWAPCCGGWFRTRSAACWRVRILPKGAELVVE